jgi:nucleoside 2-deoxyribosyltransferase
MNRRVDTITQLWHNAACAIVGGSFGSPQIEKNSRSRSDRYIGRTEFGDCTMTPSPPAPIRVYCAGPLFNQSERDEMTDIADRLVEAGYAVYLPHRDGMEFRLVLEVLVGRGYDPPLAAHFLHSAIFALDVYQLAHECDAMVWNLNGRTPDEGAVSEAAIAWALGKPLVAYMDDVRSLIAGRVNPMLVGLVGFVTHDGIDELPERLAEAIASTSGALRGTRSLPPKMQRAVAEGRMLWEAMKQADAHCDNEIIADCVCKLFAPETQPAADTPVEPTIHRNGKAR